MTVPLIQAQEIKTWIFDLDNTLYRTTPGMLQQTDELMGTFISNFLNVDRAEARRIQKSYFRSYGLTLRGLMLQHSLNPQLYIDHLSQLDLSDIKADPKLSLCLAELPGKKFIHTNAFTYHTHQVMERLGITQHFDGIFDISDADYIPKPAIEPYRMLCDLYDIQASCAVMIEDISRNLEPAAALGMTTVWIQTNTSWAKNVTETGHIDHVITDLTGFLENLIKRG